MNILFICSWNDIESRNKPVQKPEDIQLGISYISAILKKNNHKTRLIVLGKGLDKINKKIIDKHIKNFNPGLIGFTAVSTDYQNAAEIAGYIKKTYPDIFLLIGGPHASLNPEQVIKDDFDALCVGEGEYPTLELVQQLEKNVNVGQIQNLWIKKGVNIEKNNPRPFLDNLDILPFPDRSMWYKWIDNPRLGYTVLLGRGCPFMCTYCSNHALKKLAKGRYVRFRSPENIINEIENISNKMPGVQEIYLEVESFAVNIKWALELCSELEKLNKNRKNPFRFGVNIRVTPNAQFENLFKAMKRSNFTFINIGLESGSERIRREILNRRYSNQDIIRTVHLAKKYGLKVAVNNIIGIPGETIKDFFETVKINSICMPDRSNTFIFIPYPGTRLYLFCKEQGILKGNIDCEMERRKATLDLKGFSKKQIQKCFIWFDYHVFKGKKPLYKIMARVIRSKFQSMYFLNQIYRKFTRLSIFKKLARLLHKY